MTINSIKCYFDRYDCQCWQPRVVGVTNIFGCHLVSGLSVWGHGRRAQRKGQETSVRMPDPVCSFPGRPTRVPNNSVFCNWSNQIPASWRDGVRAHRAFLPGTSANWEGEVTIQISAHLDITTTPSESRGQCHARVGTLGVEGMPAMHGIKLHTHQTSMQKKIKSCLTVSMHVH